MINIQPYIDKLDLLKEWMEKKIERIICNTAYGYDFVEHIYRLDGEKGFNLSVFEQFCLYKEWKAKR